MHRLHFYLTVYQSKADLTTGTTNLTITHKQVRPLHGVLVMQHGSDYIRMEYIVIIRQKFFR